MPFKCPPVIIYGRCEALPPNNKLITRSRGLPREPSPPSAIAIDAPTETRNRDDKDVQTASESNGFAVRSISYDYGFQV